MVVVLTCFTRFGRGKSQNPEMGKLEPRVKRFDEMSWDWDPGFLRRYWRHKQVF